MKAPLKDLEQMSEGGGAAEVYKHRWAGLVCRMTQCWYILLKLNVFKLTSKFASELS